LSAFKFKIVVVSGGFAPLHVGHIRYLNEAKKLGDYLVVILNSDDFLMKKKGFTFMVFEERYEILSYLRCVDLIIKCVDIDQTVCESLRLLKECLGDTAEIIFAKGGDRTIENVPEKEICEKLGIQMVFNVGGQKVQSSSDLLKKIIN